MFTLNDTFFTAAASISVRVFRSSSRDLFNRAVLSAPAQVRQSFERIHVCFRLRLQTAPNPTSITPLYAISTHVLFAQITRWTALRSEISDKEIVLNWGHKPRLAEVTI